MNNKSALLISLLVFVVLFVVFLALWLNVTIPPGALNDYFFFAAVLVIALVSVSVYQAFRISQSAERLATGMAEHMLTSSHELFSQLYKMSPVPYVLISLDGVVRSTNISALRLFNVTEGGLDGQNVFDLIESEDPMEASLFIQEFKQGLYVNDKDASITRSDGTKRWVLLSLFPYKDNDGHEEGLLTLVDVTKQKEIDKAKSEFVSLASHQLRTPIAAMKWNLELLFMKFSEQLEGPMAEFLQKINENLRRMDHLVGDFLSTSRFELGTLSAHYTNVDLGPFFGDIFKEFEGKIAEKNINIEKELSESIRSINADPNLMHMIVSNLVSNAIKYTPDGGSVRVSTEVEGDTLKITVADTGIGVPEEEQEHLFSKIFRASNAQAKTPDGTGLGLYVALQAAKVLRGNITFTSRQNVGTTFVVELPVS